MSTSPKPSSPLPTPVTPGAASSKPNALTNGPNDSLKAGPSKPQSSPHGVDYHTRSPPSDEASPEPSSSRSPRSTSQPRERVERLTSLSEALGDRLTLDEQSHTSGPPESEQIAGSVPTSDGPSASRTRRNSPGPPAWNVSRESRSSNPQPSSEQDRAATLERHNNELKQMMQAMHNEKLELQSKFRQVQEHFRQTGERVQSEMQRLQEDRAALRASLQPPEFDGSDRIISRFAAINRAIEDWSTGASEEIVANVVCAADPSKDPTTLDIVDLPAFRAAVFQTDAAAPMYRSAKGDGRPLEIVVDFALRSIWCHTLIDTIFNRFHPVLGIGRDPERARRNPIDKALRELYTNVRMSDAQAVSGRWRTSSFKAIEASDQMVPSNTLIPNIVRVFFAQVRKLMEAIHGRTLPDQLFHQPTLMEAVEVVRLAYDWNHDVKSKDVLLEYHPVGARNGYNFRPTTMEFLQEPTAKIDTAKELIVLCGVTMGLETSEAVGGGTRPRYALHEKVKVVTHHFFDEA